MKPIDKYPEYLHKYKKNVTRTKLQTIKTFEQVNERPSFLTEMVWSK